VTVAAPVNVNVQLFVSEPPLEQAPDQIASRSFDTVSVIDVPVVNDADPVLPTATLMPAGVDVTLSPLRPVAVTVSVAACPGGGCGVTVSGADFVAPPNVPAIVTTVDALTAVVVTLNVALFAPAATVTVAGTLTIIVLLLESVTLAPPAGAAAVSVAVPCAAFPPTTLVGLSVMLDNDGAAGGGGGGGGGGGAADAVTVSDVLALKRNRPEMVTAVLAVTVAVVIPNVAVVAPAGTVIPAGTVAALLELNNCTTAPPDGAAL